MKRVLITGAQGFIGSALTMGLLRRGERGIAGDLVEFYSGRFIRHDPPAPWPPPGFSYKKSDLSDCGEVARICAGEGVDTVVHLAGRTGMQASLSAPAEYFKSNVATTQSVLESCRLAQVSHFIYASSVAVYGDACGPCSEDHPLPPPANPYAATKRLGELLAESYSSVYGLQATVLRVFSAYGIGQRPETALFIFARQIDAGLPVPLFGDGSALRDYLYLDNCVDGFVRAIDRPFRFEIINIGEQRTITILQLLDILSLYIGNKARIEYLPAPQGVPAATHADIARARRLLGYEPKVSIEEGMRRFVQWYKMRLFE
jgi:UDP-glucuronate 4-epimerase